MFNAGSVCLCSHVVVLGTSVRLSWYSVWWVTVMRVLLFVWDVSKLGECEREAMLVLVLSVSAYMGNTRGSDTVSVDDVLEMSVVRGVRGVACEMCMCLARAGWYVKGERIGFGL